MDKVKIQTVPSEENLYSFALVLISFDLKVKGIILKVSFVQKLHAMIFQMKCQSNQMQFKIRFNQMKFQIKRNESKFKVKIRLN